MSIETNEDFVRELPRPVALRFLRSADSDGRDALDAGMGFINYLALVAASMATTSDAVAPAVRAEFQKAGQKPSYGHWLAILRKSAADPRVHELFGCDLTQPRTDLGRFVGLMRATDPAWGEMRPSPLTAMSRLVGLRNDQAHGRLPPDRLDRLASHLHGALEDLLLAIPGLRQRQLATTEAVSVRRAEWSVGLRVFRGDSKPRGITRAVAVGAPMVQGSVYLWDGAGAFHEVWPFMRCGQKAEDEILWLTGFDRDGKPEYGSPGSLGQADDEDEAAEALQQRLPGVGRASASVNTEPLRKMVVVLARDGVVSDSDWGLLMALAREEGLAKTDEEAMDVVRRAVDAYGGGARVEVGATVAEPVVEAPPVAAIPAVAAIPPGGASTSPAGAAVPAPAPSAEPTAVEKAPRWAADAMRRLFDQIRPHVRDLGGKVSNDEPEGGGHRLAVTFDHPVWKATKGARSLNVLIEAGAPGRRAGLRLTGVGRGPVRSPLDGRIAASRDRLNAIREHLSPAWPEAEPELHGWLPDGDPDAFVARAVAVIPAVLRILRPVVEEAWDGLPAWGQLVSDARDVARGSGSLRKAADDQAMRDPWFLWCLGLALYNEGKDDPAQEVFVRLIELQPTSPLGHLGLARTAFRAKRYGEAVAPFERCAGPDGFPEDDDDLEMAAKVVTWKRSARYSAAALWEELRRRDPDRKGVECWLANGLVAEGRDDEAIAVLEKLIEEGRDRVRAADLLGAAYRNRGEYDRAIEALRRAAGPGGAVNARIRRSMMTVEAWRAKGQKSSRYGGSAAEDEEGE